MSEYADQHDRQIDENLRAAAPGLNLPPAPGADQIASWRTPASTRIAHAPAARRVARFRWVAAGSAVAATLAIGAILFTQGSGSSVQASTIIQNLRQKQIRGVNIAIDHVSAEGVTMDGLIQLRARNPVVVDQIGDRDPFSQSEFGAMHADLHVATDQTVTGLPNAELFAQCSFSPEIGWVYVRTGEGLAQQIAQEEPRAAIFAQMASNGLLLNVGPITEELLRQFAPRAGPDELDDMTDEQVDSTNQASARFEKMTGTPSNKLKVEHAPDGKRHVTVSAGIRTTPSGTSPTVDISTDDQAMGAIALRLLNGSARQSELDQLKSQLTKANQSATVQNLGGGRYLLTADLTDPARPQDGREATLKLSYEENGGVQWAEVSNMRDAAGTIRIEFVNDDIDPALLDSSRLVEAGKTGYIDLNMLRMMFGK